MPIIEVTLDKTVTTRYPDLRIGLLTAPVTRYATSNAAEAAAAAVVSRVTTAFDSPDAIRQSQADALYRSFYRDMGLKAAKISTPPKQAARVLERHSYSSVSPQVDICMEIEYATLISFQLYDATLLSGHLSFTFAAGDEPLTTMRSEDKVCKKNELILKRDGAVVHSCYYGNAARFIVTDDSPTALVRVMGVPGIADEHFRAVLSEAQERLAAYACIVLSRSRTSGQIDTDSASSPRSA